MIGNALSYIRERLDTHLRSTMGPEADGSNPDRVVFIPGDKLDPLIIRQGSIGMLVVNVQEDREFRDPDRYLRRISHGQKSQYERHFPDLHLEFTVLFVAQFKDYVHAWNQLGQLLLYLQENPVFDAAKDRELPQGFRRLTHELVSSSLQQQNELWSALKMSMRPAILYRFRLITAVGREMKHQPRPIHPERISTELTQGLKLKTSPTPLNPQEQPANLRSPPPFQTQPQP